MTFTEQPFWILTLTAFGIWSIVRASESKTIAVLLAASLVFYGYHHWRLLGLLVGFCVVDWAVALRIARSRAPGRWLATGVVFNLGALAYWKYTPLLASTGARLLALDSPDFRGWEIPFGISFYSFTGIAYLVDVYRRTTAVEPSLVRYGLSAAFFPHLVAGPILRPNEFLERLRPGEMPTRPQAPWEATLLIARGLFKKMVLADRIAFAVDPFFAHVGDVSTEGVWSLPYVYLYALQIYFDFSGYTDIARGLGLWFGYRWPENFNRPYFATSIQDFWRRWHMTLSRFLRDYLYVPLGGSRGGPWRTRRNLLITMLLGGLWHGASWSFLTWGGLHGLFLLAHREWAASPLGRKGAALKGAAAAVYAAAAALLTFHCVCLAWCFFRLTQFEASLECVRKWFVFRPASALVGGAADVSLWILLAAYAAAAAVTEAGRASGLPRLEPLLKHSTRRPFGLGLRWGFVLALVLVALVLSPGREAPPFIYFQF